MRFGGHTAPELDKQEDNDVKPASSTFPILVKLSRMMNDQDAFESGPIAEGSFHQGRSVAEDSVTLGKTVNKHAREAIWSGTQPGFVDCSGEVRLSPWRPPLHVEEGEIVAAASGGGALAWIVEAEDGHHEMWVGDSRGRNSQRVDLPGVDPEMLALSPDGTQVAFTVGPSSNSQEALYCQDLVGEKRVRAVVPGFACQPSWSPDGRSLVYTDVDEQIKICDVQSGEVRTVANALDGMEVNPFARDGMRALSPVFSPDGSRILFIAVETEDGRDDMWDSSELRVVSAAGGEPVTVLRSDKYGPAQVAPCYGKARKKQGAG